MLLLLLDPVTGQMHIGAWAIYNSRLVIRNEVITDGGPALISGHKLVYYFVETFLIEAIC